jgi:hypothetical protein
VSNYDNTNRGALFGNDQKREGKKDPDLQGKLNIDGAERWISAWFFTYEKDGATRRGISLALGKPVQETRQQPAQSQGKPAAQDDDGDIPF